MLPLFQKRITNKNKKGAIQTRGCESKAGPRGVEESKREG